MIRIFGKIEEGLDYQTRQSVYAVIFNEEKNKILTVHTSQDAHFLPGGGREDNESFHDCLMRELKEETGYSILIEDFIGHAQQYFISRKNEPLRGDGYFYLAQVQEKREEPIEEDHFLSWIAINMAQELLFHEYQHWAVKEGLRKLGVPLADFE